jgi:hypothetical protein
VIVAKNLPREVREKLQQASRSLGRSLGWRGPKCVSAELLRIFYLGAVLDASYASR